MISKAGIVTKIEIQRTKVWHKQAREGIPERVAFYADLAGLLEGETLTFLKQNRNHLKATGL